MRVRLAWVLALALWNGSTVAESSELSANDTIERRFDSLIHEPELDSWMKRLSSAPNHVGSAHNKENALWILEQFKSWGWDARIETFSVLYPTPISQSLTLLGPRPFHATLTEPPIAGDASTSRNGHALPAYVAYQGDGDVTASLVYVNYGMPEDYKTLQRMGVSVAGKIVIARYGSGWRGLKPQLALQHGAVGCIIYSDPRDDGYSEGDVYPMGALRPAGGIQRGSVGDMTLYPGDPLTPDVGATQSAPRIERSQARTILRIPTLPISYGDAQRFLERLKGRVAPSAWRGSLPITYRVGGHGAQVRLKVQSDWSQKEIFNVVAVLKGSQYPDQWVLRGNHRDAWVFGASDPLSGQVAMLAEAKAIGSLVAQGWQPNRTLVYLSWDAEEPNLVGSTEWVETHAAEIKDKAVIYINSDTNSRGVLSISGSHSYQQLADSVASEVTDPETLVSVSTRRRAAMLVAGQAADATETQKVFAKLAADSTRSLPIAPMGSGSDYSPFIQHLGVPALNLSYGGEGEAKGVYHSAYDTWEHHARFVDPGFVYDALLARTIGRIVLRLADTAAPAQRFVDLAESVERYIVEVKELADTKRTAATLQSTLLAANAYRLSDDPLWPGGPPATLQAVPFLNFSPLDNASHRLLESAHRFETAFKRLPSLSSPALEAALFKKLATIDQLLASDVGLPGRPWFKNLLYAPGRFTGYGAKTLPGVREAIEEERWSDAEAYVRLTGEALDAYSARLNEAFEMFPTPGSGHTEH